MTSKYHLHDMDVGQKKEFNIDLHDKIRMSAHFVGKRHDRKYSTTKKKKRNGAEVIVVTRVS